LRDYDLFFLSDFCVQAIDKLPVIPVSLEVIGILFSVVSIVLNNAQTHEYKKNIIFFL
jgi:mannose/fructose/N-acetylgalactosamine-specific phosphotransferase system component IIC